MFRAQRIDYDVPKGYAVAKGPVELTFNDANGIACDNNGTAERPSISLISNEVIFDGDVNGKTMKSRQTDKRIHRIFRR